MNTLGLRNTSSLVLFFAALLALPSAAGAQKQLNEAELISNLKKGGYVIYVRHTTTDVSKTDQLREDLSDWQKQRNLSEKGRKEAAAIGLAIRAMKIPFADVLVSPYCRCIETGKLAFGKVQVSKDLTFSVGEDKIDADQLAKALKGMLAKKPAGQTNTVLVSHSGNLQDAANLFPKPEGVAMIFKPQENNSFEFVQRIEPQQWAQMAAKVGAAVDPAKLSTKLPERAQLCQ